MTIEVKVPPLPESVADAIVASWHKKPGDRVKRDENLVDLETDKVVLEVPAPADGVLEAINAPAGATVNSGQVLALIAAGAAAAVDTPTVVTAATPVAAAAAPATAAAVPVAATSSPASAAPAPGPAATRVLAEAGLSAAEVAGSGRRGQVTKADALGHVKAQSAGAAHRQQERVPMTRLRQRIAERMMQSKNSIAMLTSFNEINMKGVMDLRKQYAEAFEKTHGIKLGFMGFFVKAAAESLKRHPVVNASTEGNDILYHGYADISIAVATERGLVTPVIRNAELKSIAEIEAEIGDYAKRAREGGLQLEELQGGTFTITNGGVFGSLFSTPIVNPPQSAILGMHAIKERPIVEAGQIVIAPMMYVALSYDHRIVDGKDAVTFLVDVKNAIENPARMLLGV